MPAFAGVARAAAIPLAVLAAVARALRRVITGDPAGDVDPLGGPGMPLVPPGYDPERNTGGDCPES